MTLEIRTNIASHRDTVVTDMGDEIDVVSFIADVFKQNPLLVSQGIHEACGTSLSEVNNMLEMA